MLIMDEETVTTLLAHWERSTAPLKQWAKDVVKKKWLIDLLGNISCDDLMIIMESLIEEEV